jgi:hypothetical protein
MAIFILSFTGNGGADLWRGCGKREASHAIRDNCSSALIGAHMPLSFILFIFLLSFLLCGADNRRAER